MRRFRAYFAPCLHQELFDFQRVADVTPGATETLYFTIPPAILASVPAASSRSDYVAPEEAPSPLLRAAINPGRISVRIGDVARGIEHFVSTEVVVTGAAPCWLEG
jgi:hypothetical protein